ncbi:MAG: hypothetical protein J5900_01795 [Prevotella sp.]|nr:hypothetical protein [Prevotella sp.]
MRKTITLLLLALLTSVGAWAAEWQTKWTNTFDDANTYSEGWVATKSRGAATSTISQGTRSGDYKYISFSNNAYNTTYRYTFNDANFSATDYKFEMDFALTRCNAGNSTTMMVLYNSAGTEIFKVSAVGADPGKGSTALVTGNVYLNGSTEAETATVTMNTFRGGVLTWYNITITSNATDGTKLTLTRYDDITETTDFTISDGLVTLGSVLLDPSNENQTRYGGGSFDNFILSVPKAEGTCATPSYSITGANGTSRIFTLSCEEDNPTIYYSETELEVGASGWTEYTKAVTTSASTVYAYASANNVNSEVINFATGAGTVVELNAPTFSLPYYDVTTSSYAVKVSSNQSSVLGKPAASLSYYTTDPDSPIACSADSYITGIKAGETLHVTASAEGYSSKTATYTGFDRNAEKMIPDWSDTYTTGEEITSGESFTVNNISYIILTGIGSEDLSGNFGCYAFGNDSKGNPRYASSTDGLKPAGTYYVGTQNVSADGYVKFTVNEAAYSSNLLTTRANASFSYVEKNADNSYSMYFKPTSTACGFNVANGLQIKKVEYLIPCEIVPVNGTSTYVTTAALDFSKVKGLTVLIATDETQGYVELSKVTQVPAGAPIIVKGVAGDYSVPVCDATTYSDGETNDLTNKLEGDATASYTVTADDNIYAIKKDKSEFRPVAVGVEIPAKKAYFRSEYPVNANAKPYIIRGEEEDPTAVSTVEVVEAAKAKKFFNAAGQQVDENYKGFVITSAGKKIINK